jgi:hypothetical protein
VRIVLSKPEWDHVEVQEWDGELASLQALVGGGYVEHVTLVHNEFGMYVNEDGHAKGLMLNPFASSLYRASRDYETNNLILGPAVFVGGYTPEGEDTEVPEEAITGMAQIIEVRK